MANMPRQLTQLSGGSRISHGGGGGRGSPAQVLFGKNVCKNKRIGSRKGGAPGTPPRSANATEYFIIFPFTDENEYLTKVHGKFHYFYVHQSKLVLKCYPCLSKLTTVGTNRNCHVCPVTKSSKKTKCEFGNK